MESFKDESAIRRGTLEDENKYRDMDYEYEEAYDYDDQHHEPTVVDTSNSNDNPHSSPVYGFRISTPNPDYVDDSTFTSHSPVLPDPSHMQEEPHPRRQWRRLKVIHLEEKEKREKEMRNHIIKEADEYKESFYEKRKLNCEKNKENNREREKGPKPGKPTDLARMRQMILKLKQNPPSHTMPLPPKEEKDAKEGKDGKDSKNNKNANEGEGEKSGKSSTPTTTASVGNKPTSPAKGIAANGEPQDSANVEGEQVASSEAKTA